MIRSLRDKQVKILKNSENSLISIEDSKSSFKILSADIEEFPEINFKIPDLVLTIERDVLIQLIELTIFSIAKISDPRYNLQGVFLEIEPLNGLSEDETPHQERDIASQNLMYVATPPAF